MRVGLLGGSFDPVHYGHLRAAQWAIETFSLDKVLLMPALQSPLKGSCVAGAEERRRMLALATSDNPALGIEDCELRRPAPSYTVDTLRELKSREPATAFVLILGADAARDLDQWRNIDAIRGLAEIQVLDRPNAAAHSPAAGGGASFHGLAISSTEVRRAVQAGRSIRYLTPESVRLFIEEKGLYK
jgi:nicotinate-nucleotide adenylyltransferase